MIKTLEKIKIKNIVYIIPENLNLVIWSICMTIMFLYISIPWIENKILKTRPEYKKYQKNVNILIPEITIVKNLCKKFMG